MPQLLTLPMMVPLSSAGLLLPGAKLYAYQTGTSTPQNLFQDVLLATPHAIPVVADGSGVFPKIYTDPSLPAYRLTLTDSAGVTLPGYPVDDIPSNQNAAQTLRLKSAAPEIIFEETDATAGNRKSRIRVNAEVILWELLNDAENTATEIMRIPRSGSALGDLTLAGAAPLVGVARHKLASTTQISTTSLADDTHLQLSLLAGAKYIVEGQIYFDASTTAGMGIKLALAYTGSIPDQNDAAVMSFVNGTGAISRSPMTSGSPLTFATLSTSARADYVQFRKILETTTAGTLKLQAAQNSSTANNLNIRIYSFMRAQKLPFLN